MKTSLVYIWCILCILISKWNSCNSNIRMICIRVIYACKFTFISNTCQTYDKHVRVVDIYWVAKVMRKTIKIFKFTRVHQSVNNILNQIHLFRMILNLFFSDKRITICPFKMLNKMNLYGGIHLISTLSEWKRGSNSRWRIFR